MNNSIFILFSTLLLTSFISCSSTEKVSLNTIRPADITLGQNVHNILLIDRTEHASNVGSILEGVLTGELPYEDQASVQELMNTMKLQVEQSPRFRIKIASQRLKGNSLSSVFPSQISWSQVNELCEQYGTELLAAVEIFDTDFIPLDIQERTRNRNDRDNPGSTISVTEYTASGIGKIKVGIRLYDPVNEEIIDQQLINDKRTWRATADTRTGAANALVNKQIANLQLAKNIAIDYAYKVTPQPIVIGRKLYKKSKEILALELGVRHAEVNEWEEAIEIWKKSLSIATKKDAGKLTYNIAVGYEVLENFNIALDYARKSYTSYDNKKANDYVLSLEQRVFDSERLDQQLVGSN